VCVPSIRTGHIVLEVKTRVDVEGGYKLDRKGGESHTKPKFQGARTREKKTRQKGRELWIR